MSPELKRLYGHGRVGMIVVLDHVSLGKEHPFAKYAQPAFFTIVEDWTPEERFNGVYVLHDSEGTVILPEETSNIASYLTEVSVWAAWKAATTAEAIATRDDRIHNLLVREGVLKEVMQNQGVRVVTTEQAKTLGLKS